MEEPSSGPSGITESGSVTTVKWNGPQATQWKGRFRVKKRLSNWAGLEYDLGDVGQKQLEYDMWVKPVHSRPVNITVTTKFIAPDGNWTYENQETQKLRPWQWAQLRGPIETKGSKGSVRSQQNRWLK